ncbi:hypothetical protein L198_05243 [Cryptococcus wingfieldii CBS 7118]|uniref:Chromo domain-containing protein n=1 Tax=Cryptococcus wingfieldii CBS 7118 TaxID=1295528 RepID=A0A1E3IXT4_9TREE|nr:hypothetical protein L198_05243 [Cryptococcus wingfieldii CBS 7118]ODN93382.1 hypothetical protein L198_05243 [Cryptococcus wingfieldii CBS 7118]
MQSSQGPPQPPASGAPPSSLAKRTTGAAGTSTGSLNPTLHNTRGAAKAGRTLAATESETPEAGSSLGDKGKKHEDANADSTVQATPVSPTSISTAQAAPDPPTPGTITPSINITPLGDAPEPTLSQASSSQIASAPPEHTAADTTPAPTFDANLQAAIEASLLSKFAEMLKASQATAPLVDPTSKPPGLEDPAYPGTAAANDTPQAKPLSPYEELHDVSCQLDQASEERDHLFEALQQAQAELTRLCTASLSPAPVPTTPTPHMSHHSTRLKPSELPKLKGTSHKEVDSWIAQISALLRSATVTESDVIPFLPCAFEDRAMSWYVNLRPAKQLALVTWSDWQEAIRRQFLPANYAMKARLECTHRQLGPRESFTRYLDERSQLQRYVFDDNVSDYVLINDLLRGIPLYFHRSLVPHILEDMSLEQFRDLLLSQEESLRDYQRMRDRLPQSMSRSYHSTPSFSNRQNDSSTPVVPRNPCTCGGYHWRRDFPNLPPPANGPRSSAPRASSTNTRAPFSSSSGSSDNHQRCDTPQTYVNVTTSSYRPRAGSVNATPNQNGNRYNQPRAQLNTMVTRAAPITPSSTVTRSVNATALTAPRPTVRFEPQPRVIGSIVPSDTVPIAAPPPPSLAPAMTPLYACRLSVIDAHYAKKYLPNVRAQPCPAIELTGLGQADSTSFIIIDITFTTSDGQDICLPMSFSIVDKLNANLLLGNNQLSPLGTTLCAPQFDVGQDVLVSTFYIKPPFFREKGRPFKLKPKFVGPFKITKKISPEVMVVDLPPHIKAHTSINISHLKHFVTDPFERAQPLPPPINADDNIYEVEHIVADRTIRGKTEYLISWKSFPDVYDTWEPASNITKKNIITKYLSFKKCQAGVWYSEATDTFPFVPISPRSPTSV